MEDKPKRTKAYILAEREHIKRVTEQAKKDLAFRLALTESILKKGAKK